MRWVIIALAAAGWVLTTAGAWVKEGVFGGLLTGGILLLVFAVIAAIVNAEPDRPC